jgi:dipeptidyl aminopeptidase/acylaminoacyl peptidase
MLRRITHFAGPQVGSPRWSSDGRVIAFDARQGAASQIFVIDQDGSNQRQITSGPFSNSSPRWSHDGGLIYFASYRTGKSEIWRQPVKDGVAIQVTEGGGVNAAESIDGRTLYYARSGDSPGIFALPLEGPLPQAGRPIARLRPGFLGHWFAGRAGIYFIEPVEGMPGFPSRLRLFEQGTGQVRDLAPLPGIPSAFDGGLALSPDEKTTLFTVLDRAGANIVISGR